ncbi:MAG: nucleoside deaminase [Nanoarchaeota archaeon]
MDDEYFMCIALEEAEIALKEGNWPIGCVIVHENKIIAKAHNLTNTTKDEFNHAEMLALKLAQKTIAENPKEITLYTTFEPCPMCFGAILLHKIKRVVSGTNADKSGAMHITEHLGKIFQQDKYQVLHSSGILANQCLDVFMKFPKAITLMSNGFIN